MNFESILNTKMDDIEAPSALPKGDYLFSIDKPYRQETMNAQGVEDALTKIEFDCTVREPGDTVDADELAAFGSPVGVTVRYAFIFNNDADENPESARRNDATLNRLKTFLERTLEIEESTMKAALAATTGRQFYGTVDHRPGRNEGEVFPEIRKTAALDA